MSFRRRVLLVVLLAMPLVLQGASLPHTHAGAPAGLFNQDHDLSLLATVGAVATPALTATVVLMVAVAGTVPRAGRHRRYAVAPHRADSRAPPLR